MDVRAAYEQWLKDFAADADTVADLKAIADKPAEMEDRFYTELSFGTAGMRGVLGAGTNRMNRYNAIGIDVLKPMMMERMLSTVFFLVLYDTKL